MMDEQINYSSVVGPGNTEYGRVIIIVYHSCLFLTNNPPHFCKYVLGLLSLVTSGVPNCHWQRKEKNMEDRDKTECVPHFITKARSKTQKEKGYNPGTGKYTPLENMQFAADWSDLSNCGLRTNRWGLYVYWGCIFPCSAIVLQDQTSSLFPPYCP